MGVGHSSLPSSVDSLCINVFKPHPKTSALYNPTPQKHLFPTKKHSLFAGLKIGSFNHGRVPGEMEIQKGIAAAQKPIVDFHGIDEGLIQKIVYDALVWSSLHGLVVGDRNVQRSGKLPGLGMVHAPIALLPTPFPESHWKQACELAPIFNELVDRVSLDGKFLQDSLARTKTADAFTSRLLDIHSKMLEMSKKEEIRLGLHRSDYMLDEKTKLLLQIELNTISSSFAGLGCLVTDLHRTLLDDYGEELGLDSKMIPGNTARLQFAEALAKAWAEYNNPRAVVMVVVQTEERNMYDQHWLCTVLRERYNVRSIRKTLAEIDSEGQLLPDGTLAVGGQAVAVIYFRAGYTPADYPSESEWSARLLMEQSSAIKCPSISYHLAGTKKIQQELAKPNVLERFLDNKDDIAKLRKCFAGLWSLVDLDIIKEAIEKPELFVMKPQREGGGNNIYGGDVKETLLRLQKEGSGEDGAYILMQRIFPAASLTYLIRDGICHKDHAISELGVYGAYLRNKENVIMNDQCGYLMRTKVSSSNEGGVAAGFAVLDSIYLT
ncbi:glutathione synthetase, chloroplastic isoform X2 [Hibiscus syriacus]|uniref:glutathione synthetase, chloroplastic isoform X1 n=1 Tax=Hibiscus syriacus TaxID=106335 RepID=UPI001922AF84|nr:glutathione synthetase, chloroplastic isoform X1 [Hibiscus syriacus]XP_039062833.1 glutathione synthetase, chloroplastic isoform X2 [Hibiscus syriacus]